MDLSFTIQDNQILSELNFSVVRGSTLGLIGPNGAGKTSLIKCLYGEHLASSGQIKLQNKDLNTFSRKQIAQKIAVVSQMSASVFDLTVQDVVRMGLVPHKALFESDTQADAETIKRALLQVDLDNKIDRQFGTLSGGEQQRALIARAIVQQAEILLLDEPTNHLDVFYQHQIFALVKSLGLTVVVSVHDLNLAAQYCDTLLLLDQGQIKAHDAPNKVLTPTILEQVFKVRCHVDQNPYVPHPRVTFASLAVANKNQPVLTQAKQVGHERD